MTTWSQEEQQLHESSANQLYECMSGKSREKVTKGYNFLFPLKGQMSGRQKLKGTNSL